MIIITGTIVLPSEAVADEVRAGLVQRAERSRADDGCIDYQFSAALNNPLELRLVEMWESEEKLQAHLAIPDPEFSALIGRGQFESAIVEAHEVSSSREMLRR